MIRHRQRFGISFRLVIDTAWADRVDISPILLVLRMNQRVAVNFRSRGEKKLCPLGFRQSEGIMRSHGSCFECLNRQMKVINRACGADKMQDSVEMTCHEKMIADIVMNEFKIRI